MTSLTPGPDPARAEALNGRLNHHLLTAPDARWQHMNDVRSHEQIEILRGVMLAADKAMEIEGVDLRTRNRVAHWIIYGHAPEPPRPDDDPPHLGWMGPGETIDLTGHPGGLHTSTWSE